MPGADYHLVDAALRSFACLAETTGHPGQVLQFKRNVFKDMSDPGPFFESAQKAATFAVAATVLDQRGKEGGESFDKAGQGVRREIFKFPDIDDGFNDRAVSPLVRAAQMTNFEELDVFLAHGFVRRKEEMGN